ncbi:MAG: hypothetical protein K8Q89_07465 [Nitrosarchaeum sp.]|nr:hypothetical protein [Nitrosarchaeum sp.]
MSFAVIVFVNSYIPRSYDMIEQQNIPTDLEKRLDVLNTDLISCKDQRNPGLVAECEYPIKSEIKTLEFKQKSQAFVVGPITYYYAGGEVDISEQEIVVFNLRMLAENTGSSDAVLLHCGGAASCNYHIWDGKTTYIHSSHDFTSGNVGLNPGQARFINILFGPAQGYGNYVDFKYDPSKEYFLKIDEPFGSAQIPLELVSKTNN